MGLSNKSTIHGHIQANIRAVSNSYFQYNPSITKVMHIRYDRDEYITDVGADYVVWEVHGRKDFRYTSTAQQV